MSKIRYSGKLLREFLAFARAKRAYWIIPLILVLGLTALLVVSGQAAAPMIYTLF
jgi:hypothetical protein